MEELDGKIAVAALLLALAGIAFLFLLAKSIEPQKTDLQSLSEEHVGKAVEVFGNVVKTSESKGNVFLTICQKSACVKAVVFEREASKMSFPPSLLEKGESVVIEGTVQEYKGELEVIVSSLERV